MSLNEAGRGRLRMELQTRKLSLTSSSTSGLFCCRALEPREVSKLRCLFAEEVVEGEEAGAEETVRGFLRLRLWSEDPKSFRPEMDRGTRGQMNPRIRMKILLRNQRLKVRLAAPDVEEEVEQRVTSGLRRYKSRFRFRMLLLWKSMQMMLKHDSWRGWSRRKLPSSFLVEVTSPFCCRRCSNRSEPTLTLPRRRSTSCWRSRLLATAPVSAAERGRDGNA